MSAEEQPQRILLKAIIRHEMLTPRRKESKINRLLKAIIRHEMLTPRRKESAINRLIQTSLRTHGNALCSLEKDQKTKLITRWPWVYKSEGGILGYGHLEVEKLTDATAEFPQKFQP